MLSREGKILFLKLNLFSSFIHLRNYGEFRTPTPSTSTHGRTRKRALRDVEREKLLCSDACNRGDERRAFFLPLHFFAMYEEEPILCARRFLK